MAGPFQRNDSHLADGKTATTSDNLALARGTTCDEGKHRIAQLRALADLGVLGHPGRMITVGRLAEALTRVDRQ
jgi:hypothetical protein